MSGDSRQLTAESPQKPQPEFETETVDDLVTLLRRAANYVEETPRGKVVAEDLRDGQEFAEEIADEWACEECRERTRTCTRGGTALCNECAGLTLEDGE